MKLLFLAVLAFAEAEIPFGEVELSDLVFVAGTSAVKLYKTKRDDPRFWYITPTLKSGEVMPPIAVFSRPSARMLPVYPGRVGLGKKLLDTKRLNPGHEQIRFIIFTEGKKGMWAAMFHRTDAIKRGCLAPLVWWGMSKAAAEAACAADKL